MEWLDAWLSKRIVIADEPHMLGHLVVQGARSGVMFLREPIVASGAVLACLLGDGLDQRARDAMTLALGKVNRSCR